MKEIFLVCLVLSGCASNSGVVPMGDERYMVSRQAAAGAFGPDTLKADALQEATAYCRRENKSLLVGNITEAKPPYTSDNVRKADIAFSCLTRHAS
jgi:hypothetical protein